MENTINDKLNLFDFEIIGNELSLQELLHTSYIRGKNDMMKELMDDFKSNLQAAAQSSSLLKSKLKEENINIVDMFIKVKDFDAFKCLVIVEEDHFYEKVKRRKIYSTSKLINNTTDRVDLDFSLMSFSDEIENENIISDGYIFKYDSV